MEKALTFAGMLNNKIYKNRNVLYDLIPPSGLLHRTEQKNELVMELAPILMNSAVNCVFVYGNPGTGKSALVTELMDELEKEAERNSIKLNTVYVNCSENRTETVVLLDLLNQLNPKKEYPRMGWTRAAAVAEFGDVLDEINTNVLIILDEVDFLLREAGDDVLYRLSRINGKVKSNVSAILISNDIKVGEYIKPKTQSAVGRIRVIFPPYSSDELFDILRERARFSFQKNAVTDNVIKKIAEIEAQRSGDARKALELLDACAKIAVSRKKDKVTLDVVNEADKLLEKDSVLNTLTGLTKHQKILFLTMIKQKGDLNSDLVYKKYISECKNYGVEPLTERRIRSFLINLDELGVIYTEVGWLKSLKKKTRKISINLDAAVRNKVRKILRDTI